MKLCPTCFMTSFHLAIYWIYIWIFVYIYEYFQYLFFYWILLNMIFVKDWRVFHWIFRTMAIFPDPTFPFYRAKQLVPTESHETISPSHLLFFSFFFYKFIYLFLSVTGLCCCVRAFSSCGERGLLFIAVHGFPFAVASLVAEHGL